MENLIELYHGKEPRVKTWDIWQGFGYSEHRMIKRVIADNLSDFEELGKVVVISAATGAENKKKGRPDESYFLNEDQFMLLVTMVKNTTESKKLKMALVKEFRRMKNALASLAAQKTTIDWQSARKDEDINIFKEFGFVV